MEAKTVRLRHLELTDITRFLIWFNDPEVTRYLLMSEPVNHQMEEGFIRASLSEVEKQYPSALRYAIDQKTSLSWIPVGNISLEAISYKDRCATMGIVIGNKEVWGKGIGPAAINVLLRHAFVDLGLNRVQLEVCDENTRAIKCYEKVGFKQEGVRREAHWKNGKFVNAIVMSILASEFQRQ